MLFVVSVCVNVVRFSGLGVCFVVVLILVSSSSWVRMCLVWVMVVLFFCVVFCVLVSVFVWVVSVSCVCIIVSGVCS